MSWCRYSLLFCLVVSAFWLVGCPAAQPLLAVSTTTHHFDLEETEWTFEVWNANASKDKLFFEVSADQAWITMDLENGSSDGPDDRTTVTVTLDRNAKVFNEAFNEATITVGSNGGQKKILLTATPDYFTEEFDAFDFDIENLTFQFEPVVSPNFYRATVVYANSFPTDPVGGFDLADFFEQSDPIEWPLALGKTVSFYGEEYDTLFISSDGFISFAPVDADKSLAGHFATPRISGLFTNLDLDAGGTVSFQQFADRIVVTFEEVPVAGSENTNNFQIEMFFDTGILIITFLDVEAGNAIVGLSDGAGVPADFYESDLSGYNTGPVVTKRQGI